MHQGFVEQNRHPFSLKGKQINASCISCHPKNLCSNCHYIGPAAKR
jgi:hypothetical protein